MQRRIKPKAVVDTKASIYFGGGTTEGEAIVSKG